MPQRVLVLGDDAKAFLAAVRSLGRAGLEVHAAPSDFSAPALRSRWLAAVHRLPPYPLGAQQWVEALGRLVGRARLDLVVPTSDSGLLMLLRHADALGRDRLVLPNAEAARLFTDKARTRQLAFHAGIPVCAGRLVTAGDRAAPLASSFGLPLVLKPRRSWTPDEIRGKRTARIVRTIDELERALDEGLAGEWVVESFFAGTGIGVSVLARAGVPVAAIQHRRLREEDETGPSTRRTSEPLNPRLLAWTRALAAASRLDGVAMFEFRWDPVADEHVLLEVNPRFWGSLPLAIAAGLDFPAMLVAQRAGAPNPAPTGYRSGCVKIDLRGDYERIVAEVEAAPRLLGRLRAAASALAQLPTLGRKSLFDSWAEDDPAPFLEERRMIVARLGAAASKRLPRPALIRLLAMRRGLRRAVAASRGGRLRLLVVDGANVARGPFAERLLRARFGGGRTVEVESAGTLPLQDRAPPQEALAAAARFGVDLSGHRSRSLTPATMAAASAIIVFDHATAEQLKRIEPALEAAVLRLPDLTDARDIVEPVGSGVPGALGEFRRISDSVAALASELAQIVPAI